MVIFKKSKVSDCKTLRKLSFQHIICLKTVKYFSSVSSFTPQLIFTQPFRLMIDLLFPRRRGGRIRENSGGGEEQEEEEDVEEWGRERESRKVETV